MVGGGSGLAPSGLPANVGACLGLSPFLTFTEVLRFVSVPIAKTAPPPHPLVGSCHPLDFPLRSEHFQSVAAAVVWSAILSTVMADGVPNQYDFHRLLVCSLRWKFHLRRIRRVKQRKTTPWEFTAGFLHAENSDYRLSDL